MNDPPARSRAVRLEVSYHHLEELLARRVVRGADFRPLDPASKTALRRAILRSVRVTRGGRPGSR